MFAKNFKILIFGESIFLLSLIFLFLGMKFALLGQMMIDSDLEFLPVPEKNHLPAPELTAQSALVMDFDSGTIIFQKNPHLKLHPASITKVVTAIVALETYPLEEIITVEKEYPVGKTMELVEGEKIRVKDLIIGLLIHSANDAGYVLAGQNQEKAAGFVNRMNQFLSQLGLENTHFVNFGGEEDLDHYSTAFDLAHLARRALKNEIFSQTVQLKELTVTDVGGQISHQLENTNELLGVIPEVRGIKTGWTPQSGECFLGLIDLNGHQLITLILASGDRFGETRKLIDWVKKTISWTDYELDHSGGRAGT